MSTNAQLIPVGTWLSVVEFLAYRLRALLPGSAQAGTVDAAGTDTITGTGTDFTTLTIGDWVRFTSLPGLAFCVKAITGPTSMQIDQPVTVTGDTLTKLGEEVHAQTWRKQQGDRRVRVKVDAATVRRYPEDRRVSFQCMCVDTNDRGARQLALAVREVFPEMGGFLLLPPSGFADSIRVVWQKLASFIPLGEDTSGRSEYAVNFTIEGGE